jgi:hypothetical protein
MKHNQYLYKTLLLSIILGILPIIPVLGFSTNSFITNSFTTTTTTKPINLISNISPVANLQSYTNTTTNNYITTYNPTHTNTNYIPQNNNNYSTVYVNNNSITQLQSSVPNSLISNISSTIPAFPNVVAYTSPISNINSFNTINLNLNTNTKTNISNSTFSPNNTSNLLLNNNQLLTTNSQLSPSSLNSFQLFKPLDSNILIYNYQSQTKEAKEGESQPLQNKPPEKIKEGYLVLVPRNSDKPLYDNYIKERQGKYDIRIISLEERKTLNKPEKIKELLKDIYYNDFKPQRKTFIVSDLK